MTCQQIYDVVSKNPQPGQPLPDCDETGNYKVVQCGEAQQVGIICKILKQIIK